MPRIALIAAALVLLVAGVVAYRLIAPRSNILTMPAASNGIDYVLIVQVPPACRDGGCEALYVLDGFAWLPTFTRLTDELSAQQRMAPVILVGIAYRDAFDTGDLRKHDFTPAFGRTPNATGGAEAFLRVLRDEIIPFAEQRLPIDNRRRGLAGHSYAGLFATYSFAEAPDLFDRYMILSPALWFDGGKIYDITFKQSERRRAVFLAADTPRNEARSQMASDTMRLADVLTSLPNVDVSRATMVGETHNSMVEPAAMRGLRALYAEGGR
ncbi:MAG: alpha/beta hydrolase [Hyphomonadaceae bacterium]|nr:alpha/beta hydrolase [Hyphomonadaceae bacterium]